MSKQFLYIAAVEIRCNFGASILLPRHQFPRHSTPDVRLVIVQASVVHLNRMKILHVEFIFKTIFYNFSSVGLE